MPIPLQSSVVYGPIKSRRLGVSLGINLLPTDHKFCLSDCIYCQYGQSDLKKLRETKLAPPDTLLNEIENAFKQCRIEQPHMDHITFCGNGEPTLYPQFKEMVQGVKQLRDQYFPDARLSILSDSTRVHVKSVREALELLDDRFMKLDAGTGEDYLKINRPLVEMDFDRMIEGLKSLKPLVLQSLFISKPFDNTQGLAYQKWFNTVAKIQPEEIHVYTIDRPPADLKVKAAPKSRLLEIGVEIREKLKISSHVF